MKMIFDRITADFVQGKSDRGREDEEKKRGSRRGEGVARTEGQRRDPPRQYFKKNKDDDENRMAERPRGARRWEVCGDGRSELSTKPE